MNTSSHHITVQGIPVEIVRKNIKNLHIAVYPPAGRVRVSVPLLVDDETVRRAVISRLAWIKSHQANFAAQPRQTARTYRSGESHFFLGRRYLLNVIKHNGPGRVVVCNKKIIDLYVRENADAAGRERVFIEWQRQQLKKLIPPLIAKWQHMLGVTVAEWGVKRMKTKWGTCAIGARRIWVNLELIKKPVACIEYVVVHEMVHLLERNHNDRFKAIMTRCLPHWRFIRAELNKQPPETDD